MPIIKPSFDGSEMDSNRYSGPMPTPGPYHGVVKGVWAAKIKSGDNAGEPQVKVLVEIDQGKFKGAGIFVNLQLLTGSAWSVNQWLDAMTDGSEKQRKVLRGWFWKIGMNADPEADKVGNPVKKIGKSFVPVGKPISFITKKGEDQEGNPRAEIDRFVIPLEGGDDENTEEDDAGLESVETEAAEADSPPPEDDSDSGDDDDPWS